MKKKSDGWWVEIIMIGILFSGLLSFINGRWESMFVHAFVAGAIGISELQKRSMMKLIAGYRYFAEAARKRIQCLEERELQTGLKYLHDKFNNQ